MKWLSYLAALALALGGIGGATAARAQKIVAVGDEWVLSDSSFQNNAVSTTNFALNVAAQFGNPGANFLAYSDNYGLTGATLASVMTGAGYNWTVGTAQPLTLATLNSYDAVFLGGAAGSGAANSAALTAYVNGGGNVYVLAGTGVFGDANSEALAWSPFLSAFGLGFGSAWFEEPTIVYVTPVPGGNALQAGVSQFTWGYGQAAFELNPADPQTDTAITGQFSVNRPLVATYNVGSVAVPEAGTVALALPALGMVAGSSAGAAIIRRRKK